MVKNKTAQMIKIHSAKEKPIRNKNSTFTQQDVELSEIPLFFPEGFEKIFLFIYIISLPYIMGLLFLFFYIAEADVERFLSINDKSLPTPGGCTSTPIKLMSGDSSAICAKESPIPKPISKTSGLLFEKIA